MNPQTRNAMSAYQQAATLVAPAVAVVLLYDKAVAHLRKAVQAKEAGKTEESHGSVMRATAILRGLSHILNFDRGGTVAEGLRAMYTRNILALHGSFGKPDMAARYVKIIGGLVELRNSWAGLAGISQVGDRSPAAEMQVWAVP